MARVRQEGKFLCAAEQVPSAKSPQTSLANLYLDKLTTSEVIKQSPTISGFGV